MLSFLFFVLSKYAFVVLILQGESHRVLVWRRRGGWVLICFIFEVRVLGPSRALVRIAVERHLAVIFVMRSRTDRRFAGETSSFFRRRNKIFGGVRSVLLQSECSQDTSVSRCVLSQAPAPLYIALPVALFLVFSRDRRAENNKRQPAIRSVQAVFV